MMEKMSIDNAHADERELVRRRCEDCAAAWEKQPGRNLILLFDGTGNILGNSDDTNVAKLLRLIRKQPPYQSTSEQIAYYDPGVGSADDFPPAGLLAKYKHYYRQLKGLMFGTGVFENLAQAYEFLCREYRKGDRIWLFGFSRGAFTARSVAGMTNMYGLVYAAGLPLVRVLVRTYFASESRERDDFATDVIGNFSFDRTPLIHFTGTWDTVESIGLTGGVRITNSTGIHNKRFAHVRQALALHETRQKYKPREYTAPEFTAKEREERSFEQFWFRGSHRDIGGNHSEDGLSNIALNWMVNEARMLGLEFMPHEIRGNARQALHDQALESPYWILTGLHARDRSKVHASVHPSALPIADAESARRSPRAWLARSLGPLLFMAALVLGIFTFHCAEAPCAAGAASWLSGLEPESAFVAQWLAWFCPTCGRDGAHAFARWSFLAVFWLWLPFPLTWSLRRLCAHAINGGKVLPAFAANAHWALWLLLAAGSLHTMFVQHYLAPSWAVLLNCAAVLAGLGWALLVVVTGACTGGRKTAGTVDSEPG